MDNFVVSARKYRPATFESVVGQKHITSTLKNAIARGQLAHAYLFCGPRGVGKTTCARIFAKAINCLSPVDSEACGRCESCMGFNEGRSFNIHELDAASNNSVDDIRALTEQVRIPPQIGRYNVFIIDEVHMLSASAFNAFLKTLEEPPAHAIFILATTEKHKIIPTILSRCQIFDFNRIRVEDVVEYMRYIASQEGIASDDESLHLIARKADGGMRDALSMFDKAVSFCGNELHFKEVAQTLNVLDYDTYFNVTSEILNGNYPSVLISFDEVLRKGFSGQIFIAGLNSHFRDLLMCKNPQTAGVLEISGSLLDRYKQQAAGCDVQFLFDSISLLTSLDGTLRTASNQRLNIELGLIKLCGFTEKKKGLPLNDESPAKGKDAVKPKAQTGKNGSGPAESSKAAKTPTHDASDTIIPEAGKPDHAQKPSAARPADSVEDGPDGETGESSVSVAADHAGTAAEPQDLSNREMHVKNGNGKPAISGPSISDLLEHNLKTTDPEDNGQQEGEPEHGQKIDPQSEGKIEKMRKEFIVKLKSERPRIAMAFGNMMVSGNTVTVNVPTGALRDEILRNRTEILTTLTELSGVDGDIALEVNVKEDKTAKRLVKSEDKLRHLTEHNPELNKLRQALDLDIE